MILSRLVRLGGKRPFSSIGNAFERLYHYLNFIIVLVRKAAPQFTAKALINGEFKQIKSSDFAGKYWVLFFYPLDLYTYP